MSNDTQITDKESERCWALAKNLEIALYFISGPHQLEAVIRRLPLVNVRTIKEVCEKRLQLESLN